MPHNGGKSQLNFWFLGNGEFLFINHLKTFSDWNFITAAREPANFDVNGYRTEAHTAGTVYTVGTIPSQTDRPGRWHFLYDDGVGATFTLNFSKTTHSTEQGEIIFTPNTTSLDFRHVDIGTPYAKNFRLIHEDDLALYNSGEIFTTQGKELLARIGVLRFLDWLGGNDSNIVNWEDRLPVGYFSYNAQNYPASKYAGIATKGAGNDYTIAFPGFVLADKSQVILKWDANATGADVTINIEGTGVKEVRGPASAALFNPTEFPDNNSSRFACLTYDEDLDVYIKSGGDTSRFSCGIKSGVPIEIVARLCKEVGAHPWVFSPYLTVLPLSDYTLEQATYLKNYADANATWMIPRYEPPNEWWNFAATFTATYVTSKAGIYAGYKQAMTNMGAVLRSVYGSKGNGYQFICGCQAFGSESTLTDRVDATEATHVSVATYWGPDHSQAETETLANEYVSATDARKDEIVYEYVYGTGAVGINASIEAANARVVAWKAESDSLGLGFAPYEGGLDLGLFTANANVNTMRTAAIYSSHLYNKTIGHYTYLESIGVEFPSKYTFVGPLQAGQTWSAIRGNIYSTPTAEWDAIVAYSTIAITPSSGGWAGKGKKRKRVQSPTITEQRDIEENENRKQRQKKNEEQLEQTIRLAYQRLTGKVTEPPILKQDASPERLAIHAEKLAAQLVEKSKDSAKQRTRNKAVIADLRRQADAIMQDEEEEEAIILLLH